MKKDHGLWTNSDCQTAVAAELPNPSIQKDETELHPQHAIVKARLLSSKVLAQEIDDVIQALRAVLGLHGKENVQASLEGSDVQKDSSLKRSTEVQKVERKKKSSKDDAHIEGSDATDSEEGSEAEEGWTGFGDTNEEGERDVESEAEEEADTEGKAAEAAGWESGTVDDADDDDDDDLSDGDMNSDTVDDVASASSDEPGLLKKARPAATPKSKGKAGESTFLPSLSVGFVKGSDSDWSDAEADLADLPQKKNRRGQRARKASVLRHRLLTTNSLFCNLASGKRNSARMRIISRSSRNRRCRMLSRARIQNAELVLAGVVQAGVEAEVLSPRKFRLTLRDEPKILAVDEDAVAVISRLTLVNHRHRIEIRIFHELQARQANAAEPPADLRSSHAKRNRCTLPGRQSGG